MKKSLIVLPLVFLSACSTIIEGRSQQLTINTNPTGAKCVLNRKDLVIGSVAETPGSVYIEKTKYDINVVCSKEGYQDATYLNHSGTAGATWGNIAALYAAPIAWGIDSATGSDNKYTTSMNITLVPEEKVVHKVKKKHTASNAAPKEKKAVQKEKPQERVQEKAQPDRQPDKSKANDFSGLN